MMRRAVFVLVGLATLLLAVGYALNALWPIAIGVAIVGILWLVGEWRNLGWPASLGFVLFVFVTIYGVLQAVSLIWLLPGTLVTLTAWDLAHFNRYLRRSADVRDETTLKQRHLLRLGVALGFGLLLSVVALGFQTKLNFIWVILLGLFAMLGLGQVVRFLRRESD